MKLATDPKIALQEVATYLRSVRADDSRKVWNSETQEKLGYWQTAEWIEGLIDLAEAIEERGDRP